MFRSDHYADVSLNQWMKLTPPELVVAHLDIDRSVLDGLPAEKHPVIAPKTERA